VKSKRNAGHAAGQRKMPPRIIDLTIAVGAATGS